SHVNMTITIAATIQSISTAFVIDRSRLWLPIGMWIGMIASPFEMWWAMTSPILPSADTCSAAISRSQLLPAPGPKRSIRIPLPDRYTIKKLTAYAGHDGGSRRTPKVTPATAATILHPDPRSAVGVVLPDLRAQ